jgi:NAD(P)H-dependent FMN reductase
MATPRILAFSGSTRVGSFNGKLVQIAAAGARAAGAEVTVVELRELGLPLYDPAIEAAGFPEAVVAWKALLKAHDGLLISSPEHNSSLSAALKNAIDWASRAQPGEPALACFDGKVAGLMAASPGMLGGLRGLVHLRMILGNIKVLVIPDQVAVAKANEAFTPEGKLHDAKQQAAVEAIGAKVARVVGALKGNG